MSLFVHFSMELKAILSVVSKFCFSCTICVLCSDCLLWYCTYVLPLVKLLGWKWEQNLA